MAGDHAEFKGTLKERHFCCMLLASTGRTRATLSSMPLLFFPAGEYCVSAAAGRATITMPGICLGG